MHDYAAQGRPSGESPDSGKITHLPRGLIEAATVTPNKQMIDLIEWIKL